jgi:hypothetical protein
MIWLYFKKLVALLCYVGVSLAILYYVVPSLYEYVDSLMNH